MTLGRLFKKWLVPISLTLAASPFAAHHFLTPIEFHQFKSQELDIRYGIGKGETVARYIGSMYSSGLKWMMSGRPKPESLGDQQEMFEYILSHMPQKAYVYPTEQFYYFLGNLRGEEFAGNIRVADLDLGVLSIVYYRKGGKVNFFLEAS